MLSVTRALLGAALLYALAATPASAQSKNLAPGFSSLPKDTTIVLMQPDIELFSLSAGGVPEPRADWTEAATQHVQGAIRKKAAELKVQTRDLSEKDGDELAEVNNLHGAVARAIGFHHMGMFALPTKDGKLNWSMGEAVAPVRAKTGADYALFLWVRDSYASSERKAAMVALALVGIGITGGIQIAYASLVDLKTGQVVWFNQMVRASGDLREEEPASETIASLLTDFPVAK